MDKEQKLRTIWYNDGDRRYVARAYAAGAHGWGVFDQTERKFVDDNLAGIDPNEPLAKN